MTLGYVGREEEVRIAVAYARKSSDETTQNLSLKSQMKALLRCAEANGLVVPQKYMLEENSTAMTLDRPLLNQVRQLMRQRKIHAVIVYSSDRLSRNPPDADVLLDEFFELGIELYLTTHGLIEDTAEHRMLFGIEMQFNRYWRYKALEAMCRGREELVEAGLPLGAGTVTYGLAITGKKLDKTISFVENEQNIIERIFAEWAWDERGATEICEALNHDGVKTRAYMRRNLKGFTGKWIPTMIYQVLKNEAYIGRLWIKKFEADGKTWKQRDEWLPLNIPRMIDEDTWKRAQELLEEGRSRNAKKGINQYLLSRRLTCGFCGGAVSGKPSTGVSNGGKGKVRVTYLNYVCSNSMGQNRLWRKTCDNKCYRCELVDREAWKWIVNLIAHPRETFGAYRSAQSMSAEDIALIRGEIGRYEGQIEKYRKKLDKYQELFVEELIDKGDFRAKKKEIDQNIVDAQAQIAALNEKLDEVAITDEQIARIEGYCQHLQKHLDRADETPFETRREILEAFGIFGKLAIEDGQKVLYLNWAIYETRLPLDRLDLTGSEPRTHRLAEPQSGDAPVFAQSSGGIRC